MRPASRPAHPRPRRRQVRGREVTAAEIARLAENILGCVTGLTVLGALCAREAVKRGWVRFSVSAAVIPLDKRTDEKGRTA